MLLALATQVRHDDRRPAWDAVSDATLLDPFPAEREPLSREIQQNICPSDSRPIISEFMHSRRDNLLIYQGFNQVY